VVYSQHTSTCTGFALAGAMSQILGIEIPEEEVYAYYKKYDDDRPGIRITALLRTLKQKETFGGFHVRDYETIYNFRSGPHRNKTGLSERTKYEHRKMKTGVLVGFQLGKNPYINLNSRDEYQTPKGDGGPHMMFVKSVWFDKYGAFLGFIIQNSWGEDFGDKGTFKIEKEKFFSDVKMVISFTIKQ